MSQINLYAEMWRGNAKIFDLSSALIAGGRDLQISDPSQQIEIGMRLSDEQLHALANELNEWGFGELANKDD